MDVRGLHLCSSCLNYIATFRLRNAQLLPMALPAPAPNQHARPDHWRAYYFPLHSKYVFGIHIVIQNLFFHFHKERTLYYNNIKFLAIIEAASYNWSLWTRIEWMPNQMIPLMLISTALLGNQAVVLLS